MFQRDGVWTFSVLGVTVRARELPRNNIAIYHPICEPVRELVEPICRGRGFGVLSTTTGSYSSSSRARYWRNSGG